MLTLNVSNNLGSSYKAVAQFKTKQEAIEYMQMNKLIFEKSRWCITTENKDIVLACSIFEDTAKYVGKRNWCVSDDVYLKRYLEARSG